MKYKNILFDLDGTLTDSKPGIVNSLRFALQYSGMDTDNMNLDKFIGPPIMDTFVNTMGLNHQKAEEITKIYRENYSKTGIYENSLYEGIIEMLAYLKQNGHTVIIATAKPMPFTKIVLDHFNIFQYFSYISASEFEHAFETKQRIIENALEKCNINDLNTAVMIGDRKYDIIAAKNVGIASIGVLYGYGDYDELSEAGADYLVENIQDLLKIIKGSN